MQAMGQLTNDVELRMKGEIASRISDLQRLKNLMD